jgi:hypothetical protein
VEQDERGSLAAPGQLVDGEAAIPVRMEEMVGQHVDMPRYWDSYDYPTVA